ncbi:hypothetical protein ACIQTZ_05460 [Paenarthrobacter sp. NPDC090520]|uniref:hypothetical protein n=1 Tax=Paenarthrobacter sp. NPDC090520 TaxID=3364382 RepID=UPI00382D8801
MSETSTRPGRLLAVQPREIKEAAFRALCAAGADPVEAQEGALAVLRAQTESHDGLSLLEELLDADWSTSARPAAVSPALWAAGYLHEFDGGGQPALRTALQIMDVVQDVPYGSVSVVRTVDSHIPLRLWNDLVRRRSAAWGRRIIMAASDDPGLPPQVRAALRPTEKEPCMVVVAFPEPVHREPEKAVGASTALEMHEKEWQIMYGISRNYLVDA